MKTTKILSIIFGTLIFFAVVLSVFANPRILYLPFTDLEVFLKHGWYYDEQETDEHKGIDYFKGQSGNWQEFEILAVAGGVAEYRPNGSPTWGNYVVIDHQTGSPPYYTVYAHLESSPLPAYTPTAVNEGDLIGIAGATGLTDPPGTVHLHLEWSKDGIGQFGTKLDPYGIKKYYTYYPGYPNFIDCGIDLQNPGVFWWTECPPVPPGGGGDDPLPVINVSGTISEDTTWEAGYVYLIQGSVTVVENVTLTLEPGVIVKFQNTSSRFNIYGNLYAQGTQQNKIYFTSYKDDTVGGDSNGDGNTTSPASQDWRSIIIHSTGTADLSNVIIQYGGYSAGTNCFFWSTVCGAIKVNSGNLFITNSLISNNNYGIYVINTTSRISSVNVIGTIIDNNGPYGVYYYQNNKNGGPNIYIVDSTISNHYKIGVGVRTEESTAINNIRLFGNTFINNKIRDGSVIAAGSGSLIFQSQDNVTFGTGGNGFELHGILLGDQTWNPGVPYVSGGSVIVPAETTLTINPGTIVKSLGNNKLLGVYGTLSVQATPQNRVYFTSYKDDTVGGDSNGDGSNSIPAPADWTSIFVYPNSHVDLSHIVVRYGGKSWYNCGACVGGLYVEGGELTIFDSLITKNNYGIYQNSGSVNITQSSIKDNTSYGIYHTGTGTTIATSNWWGDASGPYHPQNNPNGQGDRVSNNVEFSSWLIEDPFWKKFIFPKK